MTRTGSMNPVREALQVLGASFRDLWQDLWMSLVCNLLWLVATALVIPGPPATLALFYYGNRQAHGEMTDLGDVWRKFRQSWGAGWRWGIVNLAVIGVIVGDIYFTGGLNLPQGVLRYMQGFYLAVLGFWLLVQIYALAFMYQQEQPNVRMALRNGAVLLGRNIFFSIVLGLMAGVILLAGMPVFMLSAFFGGVYLAGVGNHAVIQRLGITE
jgi:hypothetical protein